MRSLAGAEAGTVSFPVFKGTADSAAADPASEEAVSDAETAALSGAGAEEAVLPAAEPQLQRRVPARIHAVHTTGFADRCFILILLYCHVFQTVRADTAPSEAAGSLSCALRTPPKSSFIPVSASERPPASRACPSSHGETTEGPDCSRCKGPKVRSAPLGSPRP